MALLCLLAARPAQASIFLLGVVDTSSPGFHNGDGDAYDAVTTLLGTSDGIPGNSGFTSDTVFVPVGGTVWLGIGAQQGVGDLSLSSDNGSFTDALCGDNNANGRDFQIDDDACLSNGIGTNHLQIPDAGNDLDGLPPSSVFRMGLVVAFTCDTSGIGDIYISQNGKAAQLYSICLGSLDVASLSASATRLDIDPQAGGTADAILRLDLFDAYGQPVPPVPVTWKVDNCSVETDDVDTIAGAVAVLDGQLKPDLTVGPDSDLQEDVGTSLLYDFDGDGKVESLALAILECGTGRAFNQIPGPIHIQAEIPQAGAPDVIATLTLGLGGPPNYIVLDISPKQFSCGSPATLTASILDASGLPVSDNVPIDFSSNLGVGNLLVGAFGGTATTRGGQISLPLNTAGLQPGTYSILVTAHTFPPITSALKLTCGLPAAATSATPAPATATPSAEVSAAVSIRPPSTGDGGLLP